MSAFPFLPSLEKAEAYLNVHLTHSGPCGACQPGGPFVTISRQSGTGGTEFARALARELPNADDGQPWAVYSGNLIEEMLRTNNLPPRLARFLPEDRISEVDAAVGEIVGLHPNLWDLVEKTNELIRRIARAGHAILLGRGANFATADIARGVHVRLVACAPFRAARAVRLRNLDHNEALTQNALSDAARRRYVRSNFAADIADAAAYDLVLNVEHVPLTVMVDTVVALVHRHVASALTATTS